MNCDIIITTWNNLEYLKILIESIHENSNFDHSIYVYVNEGNDGTFEWLDEHRIQCVYSKENVGLCVGSNKISAFGNNNYLFLVDDDMVCLPEWDLNLVEFVLDYNINKDFLLCPIMIEPIGNNTHSISPINYGRNNKEFNKDKLLQEFKIYKNKLPVKYSTWGPFVISRLLWESIGGYSTDISLAIGSDDDLVKKVWDTGYKDIVGVPSSLVYHFQSVSTSRVQRNNNYKLQRNIKFGVKYKISLDYFHNSQLRRDTIWEKY